MECIAQRELRNQISDVLRRAEAGERFVVTVGGRPVAELGPHERRRWVSRARLRALAGAPAPVGMLDDLREAAGDPELMPAEGAISAASLAELHFGVRMLRAG